MNHEFEMKSLAKDFRVENGFGKTEPIRLTSLLMKLNIITFFRDIDENISGISLKVNDDRFILINSLKPLGRQHFTICHELYHLYFEKEFESNVCFAEAKGKRSNIEIRADLFASCLLLPEDGIYEWIPKGERMLNKITLMTLIKTEQYYSCSRGALLMSLKKMKLINSTYYDKYIKDVIADASRLGYDTAIYKPGNAGKIIGDYGEKAQKLFDSGKISQQNYVTILQDAGIKE